MAVDIAALTADLAAKTHDLDAIDRRARGGLHRGDRLAAPGGGTWTGGPPGPARPPETDVLP